MRSFGGVKTMDVIFVVPTEPYFSGRVFNFSECHLGLNAASGASSGASSASPSCSNTCSPTSFLRLLLRLLLLRLLLLLLLLLLTAPTTSCTASSSRSAPLNTPDRTCYTRLLISIVHMGFLSVFLLTSRLGLTLETILFKHLYPSSNVVSLIYGKRVCLSTS